MKPRVKVVTGYVPLTNRSRTQEEFRSHGARLLALPVPIRAFVDYRLEDCWLYTFLKYRKGPLLCADGGNPQNNTEAFHIVIHQKTEWMCLAAQEDKESDVFVWIDYGIFHLSDITEQIILDFLEEAAFQTEIAAAGSRKRLPLNPAARIGGLTEVFLSATGATFIHWTRQSRRRQSNSSNRRGCSLGK